MNVTMTHAQHSCGIEDDGQIVYGGEAAGYVIQFENGMKIYHSGDTNVFGDMRLIHELYHPDIAMIPIGDRFTMGPREAAYACELLRPKSVIPMHFGTFPLLTGTPAVDDPDAKFFHSTKLNTCRLVFRSRIATAPRAAV